MLIKEDLSTQSKFEFRIEEYKSLREEIARHDRSRRFSEYTVGLAAIYIYSWFFDADNNDVKHHIIIYYIPFILVCLGILREWGFRRQTIRIAGYIQDLESFYSLDEGNLGWETRLDEQRKGVRNRAFVHSVVLYWLSAFVITYFVSGYLSKSSIGKNIVDVVFDLIDKF